MVDCGKGLARGVLVLRCPSCLRPSIPGNRFCGHCGVALDRRSSSPTWTVPGESSPDGPTSAVAGGGSRFLPGTVLAERYRIVSLIGSGGMGEVCRADDLKLGQSVALKFLPEGLERDAERLRRLFQEVRVARQISHPNVCRVYDIAEVDGQHFLSMEYVDGEDLSSLLRRIGRLPEDKAVQIARQLCAGVAAAHERGILHRDLKPSNVMIDGRGQVRITDFGLASLVEEVRGREVRAGTPEYMSPEQTEGREVSIRSDVYALGHVLYELFTGRSAFRADSVAEVHRLQREATPTSPIDLVPTLDPAIERVILRCLEKDPLQRPASALAVAAALPGGDPLAAALAAGETPSPEMVAASGPDGGLRPGVAVAVLGSLLGGLAVAALLLGSTTIYGVASSERSVASLETRARELVRELGYAERAGDSAREVVVHRPALDYFARQDRSAARWEPLSRPGEIGLYFAYRRAEGLLVPRGLRGRVTAEDPAPRAGNIRLTMGLDGRLLYFLATPAVADHRETARPEMDWSRLFAAAGLDIADFEPATPRIRPQAHSEVQRAWRGILPHRGDLPVRVEASALDGKPIYFETVTPYDPYWSAERERAVEPPASLRVAKTAVLLLVVLIVGVAFWLAPRNLRMARGDRGGAMRLAIYVLLLRMLHWIFTGHHVPDFEGEFDLLLVALGGGLILAVLSWLLYMAIEPYFRRLWPGALVSWTRLLAGRLRDPLVGRDLLVGFGIGIGLQLLAQTSVLLPRALGLPPPAPLPWGVEALVGGRWAFGQIFSVQLSSLAPPLAYALLFLLLRMVLRRQRLAVVAFGAILALLGALQFAPTGDGGYSIALAAIGVAVGLAEGAVLLIALLRFGVLTLAGSFLMFHMLVAFPITLDPAAAHFGTSAFALLVAVALAGSAFYTSLAGRPLFQDALLREQAGRTA